MKTLTILIVLFAGVFLARSQQLVYKPVNPAFGGDTFNYQWLLSSASAQNQFDDKQTNSNFGGLNSLDSFSQSLNRQALSQLSSKLFKDQFGDGAIEPGNYMFGSLYLQIAATAQGLLINILDTATGDQSEIIIPK